MQADGLVEEVCGDDGRGTGTAVPSVPETEEKGIRVTEEGNGNIVERLRRRPEYLFLYKHIPWT